MKIYKIKPVPKPRMSRQDAWLKRDCVTRYWNFKAHCKLLDLKIPEKSFKVYFVLPMPDSWSKKKLDQLRGKPHKQKPDLDNMIKALLDAVLEDDEHIHEIHACKFWGNEGVIIIEEIEESKLPS